MSDSKDNVSLYDHTSGASVPRAASAELSARSQWQIRDAAARLANRNHLPLAELTHFGEHKTAKALYDAVVARYSSLPHSVRDHFLARCPTELTVALLEKHLLAAEKSIVAVAAARGAPRTPIFEGCSPSPLAPTFATTAAVDLLGAEWHRGGVVVEAVEEEEVAEGVVAGVLAGVVASAAAVEVVAAEGVAAAVAAGAMVAVEVAVGVEARALVRDSSSSRVPKRPSSFVSGLLSVGDLGVVVAARMSFAQVTARVRHAGSSTPSTAASPSLTTPDVRRWARTLSALAGLHLPSFSTNLVNTAVLQDAGVDTFTPGRQRVAICTCSQTDRHLATFTRRPRSLPPLPASPAPPCLPCVEGRQRAAPHSSSFSLTEAPLQTLHLDVWGPARVRGQGGERYFLLVVDDYSRYTTVFPLRTKGEVPTFLIPWIRAVRLQLRRRFRHDLPVLRLHSDRGGEFTSDLLRAFCQGEGIEQSFTLRGSLQHNGVAERRIGVVMEVSRTSLIHAAAPHFLWPFAVLYAAQQLNLWLRVSLLETSPTLRWTEEVGDASRFRVWGARALVRDTSAEKLSSRTIPCVFLGFVPDGPGWKFYHPTSRRVFPSPDVTFDESVPFYRIFPYHIAPLPPPPLFLAPGPPPVDPLPPHGPAPSGVSQVDPPPLAEPVEVTSDSGAAAGGAVGGAASGGAEPAHEVLGSAEPGGAEPASAEPWGAEPVREVLGGAEPGGAEPTSAEPGSTEPEGAGLGGAESTGVPLGLVSRREPVSPQQAREWLASRTRLRSRAARAACRGGAWSAGVSGPGGARTGGTRAAETGTAPVAGGVGSGGAAAGGTGTGGPGAGAVDPGIGGPGAGGANSGGNATGGAGAGGAATGGTRAGGFGAARGVGARGAAAGGAAAGGSAAESMELEVLLLEALEVEVLELVGALELLVLVALHCRDCFSLLRHRRLCHRMTPCFTRFLASQSDLVCATHPTVTRLLATVVTDPSFESAAVSALVSQLVDFVVACRLDFAASLVAESGSVCPPFVKGECALGTDVLEDRQEDFECLAAAAPHLVAMLLSPEGDPDAPDIPTPRS
ncbi:unnamed protein product [Closterium sp. NIES-65]|nr:unnamed protein product [Closterium sp. NIES-65]